MKHLFLLLALLFVGQASQAQQLDTAGWCPAGAVWVYEVWGGMWYNSYEVYSYEKDTLILGQAVKKLQVEYVQTNGPNSAFNITPLDSEFMFMRNDSLYYYESTINDFLLLFDFNPSIGDRLVLNGTRSYCQQSTYPNTDTATIVNIDTFGLIYYNKDSQDSANYYQLANVRKYIGSNTSMFPEANRLLCPTARYYTGLVCYKDNVRGNLSEGNIIGNYYSCDGIISSNLVINDQASDAYIFSIFPNPANHSLRISINNNEIYNYYITDITGRRLVFGEISNNDVINIQNLPQGIYIFSIQSSQKVLSSKKFIKYD